MRKRFTCCVGVVLLCIWASAAYAQTIGDWEGAMDGWAIASTAPPGTAVAFSTTGVTRNASSLKVTVPEGAVGSPPF